MQIYRQRKYRIQEAEADHKVVNSQVFYKKGNSHSIYGQVHVLFVEDNRKSMFPSMVKKYANAVLDKR